MRHKLIYLVIVAIFFAISANVYADEIVHIPDSAFKKALILMEVDINKDGEIQYSEAAEYPGDWDASGGRDGILYISKYVERTPFCTDTIKDLTGIKAFTNISMILCYSDYVGDSLDLSGMKNLIDIQVYENKLKYLDVSNCTSLKIINCTQNELEELDVTNCTSLEKLSCWKNQLKILDVSDCINLVSISANTNQLTNIFLPNSDELLWIGVSGNHLQKIDIPYYPNLIEIAIKSNKLCSLNAANLPVLKYLDVKYNLLIELDMRNKNNKDFQLFKTIGNHDLECISVDNPEWSKENWTNIDEWTRYKPIF